jgi:hypothetical protein
VPRVIGSEGPGIDGGTAAMGSFDGRARRAVVLAS